VSILARRGLFARHAVPVARPLLAAVVAVLVAAPAAQAATAFRAPDGGVFVGGDPTINGLVITTPNPTTIRVRAAIGTVDAGTPECTPVGADAVDCSVTTMVVEVNAAAENDIIDVDGPIVSRLYGGTGNDVLRGGSLADGLYGEAGHDQLFGRAGNDDLRGDDGDDRLDGEQDSDLAIGGLGADTFDDSGTSGVDSVTYKVDSVLSGVRLTVGDGANDGRSDGLEQDNVRPGFERLQGSSFNDVIRGSDAPETINGSSGADDIQGGGGADTIEGNGGNDTLRAQDGIADARLDCDAASDPPDTHGTADVAFVDAVGTDPAPSRCETVNHPGGPAAGSPATPAAPRNTVRPTVEGSLVVGRKVTCRPGEWTAPSSFTYAWYLVNATGGTRKVGDGPTYNLSIGDGQQDIACVVLAAAGGQNAVAASARNRVAALPVRAPAPVKRSFPDFTAPTKQCGAKNFCEADEVRRKLEALGFAMTFKAKPVEGLRKIPRELRAKIRPGQVFKTTPRPAADVTASLADPLKVSVSHYVPNSDLDCPIGETVEVRGGRDFSFNELLVGLSLRDAVKRLKAEKCTINDYEVDYRFRPRSGDPVVSVARTVADAGRDQVRLTVDHGAADLQLSFVAANPPDGRVPLRLAGTGNELKLVTSKKQTTDLTVHVGMRAGGAGFRRLRVELRKPSEDIAAVAFTDERGLARFPAAKITSDGAYEVWASHTDAEGDSLVGWKQIRAEPFKKSFTGFDGTTYRYADGRHTPAAGAASVRAKAAADGDAVAQMRRQALRIRAGLLAFQNSAAGQAQRNRLSDAQVTEVGSAYNALAFFGEGTITLEQLIKNGVRPTIATLGGTQPLAMGPAASVPVEALAVENRSITRVAANGIRVGPGALGFVTESGATLFADGSYFLQGAGGNGFRNGSPIGPAVLDVVRSNVAIDTVGPSSFVGVLSDNGLGLVSDNGLGIISNDGASLVSGGGGNIVAGGAGNIISNDGASIVSAGAGNIISNDGASLGPSAIGALIGQDGAG
jgi:Ca2+-binding RTX toxin-like protein